MASLFLPFAELARRLMGNDYAVTLDRSKKLEALLRKEFKANGNGLTELANDVAGRVPDWLLQELKYIASERNKVVHEDDRRRLDDKPAYKRACKKAEEGLRSLLGPRLGLVSGLVGLFRLCRFVLAHSLKLVGLLLFNLRRFSVFLYPRLIRFTSWAADSARSKCLAFAGWVQTRCIDAQTQGGKQDVLVLAFPAVALLVVTLILSSCLIIVIKLLMVVI